MKVNFWASGAESVPQILNCGSQEKLFSYGHLATTDLDMETHGWVLMGTAEIVISLQTSEEVTKQALVACAATEQKLRADFEVKMRELQAFRQTLLALPAEVSHD